MARKLILEHKRALGDTVLFAALIRDIARQYPGEFLISPRSYWNEVWENNPYTTPFSKKESGVQYVKIDYENELSGTLRGTWHQHFVTSFHSDFTRKLKLPLECSEPKGDLHLSDYERTTRLIQDPYWIVMAGWKYDMPAKQWEYGRFQEVIDTLRKDGLRFVQIGSGSNKGYQPTLQNVLNLVSRTNLRDMFQLIHHCEGIICPVTSGIHIAAWADKPCVVIAGGREAESWEHYCNAPGRFGPGCSPVKVEHRFHHRLGQMPCAPRYGCDKHLLDQNRVPGRKKCDKPHRLPTGQLVAHCMDTITPQEVIDSVLSYYRDGTLTRAQKTITYPRLSGLVEKAPESPQETPGELSLAVKPAYYLQVEAAQARQGAVRKAQHRPGLRRGKRPGRTPGRVVAAAPVPAPIATPSNEILDHPIIGGKFTIFVLTYGDYGVLSSRCLDSIVKTLPHERFDLRVGLNQPSPENEKVVLSGKYPITKHYLHRDNAMKYPVMREMFHDPQHPIQTNYLLWFDDDSYVVSPEWWVRLSELIISEHPKNKRMFGHQMFHPMNTRRAKDPRAWFRAAPWFRHRQFRNRQQKPAPNGDCIWFCVGGFWALETAAMRQCDIPDTRLYHNGGDITIGEQLWQGGLGMQQFNAKKQYVKTSGAARRGFTEKFQWER